MIGPIPNPWRGGLPRVATGQDLAKQDLVGRARMKAGSLADASADRRWIGTVVGLLLLGEGLFLAAHLIWPG